jgi:hypothetical protein
MWRMGNRRFWALAFLACLIGPSLAWGAAAAPASRPAGAEGRWAGPKDEQWLASQVQEELRRSTGPQARKALASHLEELAMAWLATDRMEAFELGNELVHAMRACTYLALLEAPGDKDGLELAKWLLEHEEMRRVLFRAIGEARSPGECLKQFRQLQGFEPAKVVEYPNLAAAFATAAPVRHYREQPEPATLLESFLYYADPKRQFCYNLKKMPYELSRYLADTRLSVGEREWAYKRYARAKDPGAAYFHVKYDLAYFKEHKDKKVADLPYSLQNLAKVGGVCIDQAYYAAQVAKATGIPATIVHGEGVSGIGHAWFAYFQMNPAGTTASWTGGAGRYASQLYFTGQVTNPATGGEILDSELVLVGSAALLPLQRREEAEAATVLAKLAADLSAQREQEIAPAVMEQWATEYKTRQAAAPAAAPAKLETKWCQPKRKISLPVVEALLSLAIKRNLAYGPAWRLVADLRKKDRLSLESLDQFLTVLISKTAKEFPDQSCQMVLELVPTLPDADRRDKAYKKSLTVYGQRPDLRGRILLASGDDARQQGQKAKALAAYLTAANDCIQVPDVALRAAAACEELLSTDNKKAAAVRLYQNLFAKTQKEDCAEEFRKQTSHYKLGTRLAELLRDSGKADAADKITAGL